MASAPTSDVRRLAGSAALLVTAGSVGAAAVASQLPLLGLAAVLGVAAIGLSRKSVGAQVFSRAVAWAFLTPAAAAVGVTAAAGISVPIVAVVMAVSAAAALALSRPMLETPEVQAQFAPVAYRRWLLGGCTAAAASGLALLGAGGLTIASGSAPTGAILAAALGTSLLASVVGILRMRGWGLLLAGATSLATLVGAAVAGDVGGAILLSLAIPGFLLFLPVVLAGRARAASRAREHASAASGTRISEELAFGAAARAGLGAVSLDGASEGDIEARRVEASGARIASFDDPSSDPSAIGRLDASDDLDDAADDRASSLARAHLPGGAPAR